jgi:hypothetical protein
MDFRPHFQHVHISAALIYIRAYVTSEFLALTMRVMFKIYNTVHK